MYEQPLIYRGILIVVVQAVLLWLYGITVLPDKKRKREKIEKLFRICYDSM